jgi:hypothetical protein
VTYALPVHRIVWLFIAGFCFYAAFAPMGQYPSDAANNIETARSIWHRGTTAIVPTSQLSPSQGRANRFYSKYGLLNALIFVPAVAAGNLTHFIFKCDEDLATRSFLSLTNTFFAAGCLALMYLSFLRLGYPERLALTCICVISCGSLILPYSKILFAETATAFLLLLFLAWLSKQQESKLKNGDCVYLGLLCVALVWLKIANVIDCLIIAGFVGFKIIKKQSGLKPVMIFICITILSAGAMVWFNWIRFGTFWNSGYGGESFKFDASLFESIPGLLFSPSHSIIFNAPLLICALMATVPFFKKHTQFASCIAILMLINFFFYAKWFDWKGGWGWGPRLLVPALIIMHFFLIEFIASKQTSAGRKILFGLLFHVAIIVNLLGALIWYQQVHMISDDMWSIQRSHPVVAAKLFVNKLQEKPEIYPASALGVINNLPGQQPQDDLDFSNYETFQGFALLWTGLTLYTKWRFAIAVPWLLLFFSLLIVFHLRKETLSN